MVDARAEKGERVEDTELAVELEEEEEEEAG